MQMEAFNYELQRDRIEALRKLPKQTLQRLSGRLSEAHSGRDGLTLVVDSIVEAHHSEWEAENRMWDAIDGGTPATVSMHL